MFAILLLFISACTHAPLSPPPSPQVPTPAPSSRGSTRVEITVNPGVSFDPDEYYTTPAERATILSAGALANAVIQSDCFAKWMVQRKLIQTNGLTNAGVVTLLRGLSAHMPVKMYYARFTSAEAYRQPPETTINLNRKFFGADTPVEIWAATLGHEGFGHALGNFDHDYKWSPSRSFSVPYSIGGADTAQGGDAFDTCFVDGKIID